MKQWLMAQPAPARAVVAGSAFLILLLLFWLGGGALRWWLGNLESIGDAEPRIARLSGYIAVEDRLKQAVSVANTRIGTLAFSETLDSSQAGAQLQQQLRSFAEDAGLTVRGSQVDHDPVEADEDQAFDYLTVQLNMTGEPMAIDDFLTRVFEAEPLMVVESLNLSQQRLSARQRRRQQVEERSTSELAVLVTVTAAKLVGG